MSDEDEIEQSEVEYDIEEDSLSFKFNIDGIKLKFPLEEEEEEIFIEKGDLSIEAADNVCTQISLNVVVDEFTVENIIVKSFQYVNYPNKIDPATLEDAWGDEIFSIEYILYPDLLKDISIQIGENQWIDFSELDIEESVDLMDTSNYYINNISLENTEESDEFENIFEDEEETDNFA